ncbi:MAG: c-type cytochrome [Gammaproteobacteria bacterium]
MRLVVPLLLVSMASSAWAAGPAASGTATSSAATSAGAPASAGAAQRTRGFFLSQTCAFCHGVKDYVIPYPTRHVPLIGGQHAKYIRDALKEYAEGHRKFPTMNAQASSLTQKQIHDIAAYISGLAPNPPPTNGNQKAPPFAASCAACHGARGVSTNPEYPSLAGQYEDYLLLALKEYKSGKRKNAIMNGEASGLTLAQMKRLAHYFGSREKTPLGLLPLNGPIKN